MRFWWDSTSVRRLALAVRRWPLADENDMANGQRRTKNEGRLLFEERRVREIADHGGADLPDVARVLDDRPIGRELPHPRDVEQRFAVPRRAVAIFDVDLLLHRDVLRQVGQVHIFVARAEEPGDDRPEDVLVAA